MKRIDTTTVGWDQYQLLDSGDGRKLEQFGSVILDRPDPQALWSRSDTSVWVHAQGQFVWADKGERWKLDKGVADSWTISYGEMKLTLSLKGFKHVGIFPEHETQWNEVAMLGKKHKGVRVLNLFGYTGAASIAAAQAGMQVTHVDASKTTIATVKENIKASHLPVDSIRIIAEDALKYAKRLVAREEQFEVILMDPPAFGRGPKGEVWKIEESIQELMALIPSLMSPQAKLVIVNGYASGFAARTFAEFLQDALKEKKGEIVYGDVGIIQKGNERLLTTGIYAKWRA